MISKQLRKNVLNAFSVCVAGVIALTPVDTLASEGETPMSTIEYDISESISDTEETELVIIEDEPVPVAVSVDVKGNVYDANDKKQEKWIIAGLIAVAAAFVATRYYIFKVGHKN